METFALVLVLLQGGQPRLMHVIPGYTRQDCDRAIYLIQTSPPPQQPQQKEIIRPIAWCMLGPAGKP